VNPPRFWLMLLIATLLANARVVASDVVVRREEGSLHAFLVLSTLDGKPIAAGDVVQVAHGKQVTARVIYHFNDGSLQDETTVFSQRRNFSLISYHLIQKGPTFPHPTEMVVSANGQVTVQYTDDKGNEKTENERMKLPPDLANGLLVKLLMNLPPGGEIPKLSMVVATPKPRIIKLSISSQGKDSFTLAGSQREALHYAIKVEIGGLAGVVAPLLGKQPPDAHVWITSGEGSTFVKSETPSFLDGPMWRSELVAPVWAHSEHLEPKESGAKKQ
jgi:hypothetical protein